MAATRAGNTENWAENRTLAARLSREITGEVLFDSFNRGRYATDASFYQIVPAGVVIPRNLEEPLWTRAVCRDAGQVVTPRAGGTSHCGRTANNAGIPVLWNPCNRT